MSNYDNSTRREVLKTIGASSAATATFGLGVGTAAAVTPVSDAVIKERVFSEGTSGMGYDQWDSMRWRIYGTNMYGASTVKAICSDIVDWCDNVISQSWDINEYRVVGRTTNIDPFYNNTDSPQIYADEYVEEFGHDAYGGGNLWLDEGGKAYDKTANGPTGPEPYRNRNDDTNANYPHAFKADGKVDGIYWAAVHECAHLLSADEHWSSELSGTSGDHELADVKNGKSTVFTKPHVQNDLEKGDCTGNESDATAHSLQVSSCSITAFEDSTDGWRNY